MWKLFGVCLTPRNLTHNSKIQKIICASIYFRPGSKKKSLLLDHLAETHGLLSAKYGNGAHFIFSGDTNDLYLEPILNLSPKFVQIVDKWTRLNPPAILDPVIMTLSNLYQRPVSLDPLEADVDKVGVESDHRIVICKPINIIENQCSRSVKVIKFRPLSESGYKKMQEWLLDFDWKEVYEAETADNKAEKFQKILVQKVDTFFPIKTRKVCNDDQPWFTFKLKKLDSQRKRVYRRERRSIRWKNLDSLFKQEMKSAKSQFYKKEVAHLKLQNPGKWYQCLKKFSSHDQHLQTEPTGCPEKNVIELKKIYTIGLKTHHP